MESFFEGIFARFQRNAIVIPMLSCITRIHFLTDIPMRLEQFCLMCPTLTHVALPFYPDDLTNPEKEPPAMRNLPRRLVSVVMRIFDIGDMDILKPILSWWVQDRQDDDRRKLVRARFLNAHDGWKASIDGDDIWASVDRLYAQYKDDFVVSIARVLFLNPFLHRIVWGPCADISSLEFH
jgi:hypothetical protein